MNTRIRYLYRDASNYKAHGSIVLEGRIADIAVEAIRGHLQDGEHFIPGQVGLPDLQYDLRTGWDDDDDHPLHELVAIESSDEPPTIIDGKAISASDFVSRFLAVTWDPGYLPKR